MHENCHDQDQAQLMRVGCMGHQGALCTRILIGGPRVCVSRPLIPVPTSLLCTPQNLH